MREIKTVTMKEKTIEILERYFNDDDFFCNGAAEELLDLFSVSNWVEVRKATPKSRKKVLCYDAKMHLVEILSYNKVERYFINDRYVINEYITHWKEIPNPPYC